LSDAPPSSVILVKLGGSLITDKAQPGSVRRDALDRLAVELREGSASRGGGIILGHGSGSFGHAAARQYGFDPSREAQPDAVAATQDAAARLHRHVVSALLAAGVSPFSIVPGSAFAATGGRAELVAGDLPELVLRAGLLPVVYGDVVADRERGATILSTETLFLTLVRHFLAANRPVVNVLWLGETEGVLDSEARVLGELDAACRDLPSAVGGASGVDVTGGMRHRVETAIEIARLGVPSFIADGRVPGLLRRSLEGEIPPGTLVRAVANE